MTGTIVSSTEHPSTATPQGFRWRFAVLCDYASLTNDDKLNLLGIFGSIRPPALPITLGQFFVVVVYELSGPSDTVSPVAVGLTITAPDGTRLVEVQNAAMVRTAPSFDDPDPLRPRTANVVMGLGGLTFPKAGDYRFTFSVEGVETGSVNLYVTPPVVQEEQQ